MKKYFVKGFLLALLVLVLVLSHAFYVVAIAQEKPQVPTTGMDVKVNPVPTTGTNGKVNPIPVPAAAPVPVAVPAEIQELLADLDMISDEIQRIIGAAGDAVKIPVSIRTLQARFKTKNDRYLAWLDAQKVPREWVKAGWKLERWIFLPPPAKDKEKP